MEKEGDLPVLIEPLLACLRQERYIFIKDLYIWQYPMIYENAATLVRTCRGKDTVKLLNFHSCSINTLNKLRDFQTVKTLFK